MNKENCALKLDVEVTLEFLFILGTDLLPVVKQYLRRMVMLSQLRVLIGFRLSHVVLSSLVTTKCDSLTNRGF